MRGLEDLDSGIVALDLHRLYQIDLTDELLERVTWRWLVGRCQSLFDLPGTYLRRAATDGI